MVRVLAVSDEVDEGLRVDLSRVGRVELIVSCGDLPSDYLAYLMDALRAPLVLVPGNHDPDMSGFRLSRQGVMLRAGLPDAAPWPAGAVNADARVVDVLGLRIAGLGGCLRYRDGPNQYTERQQTRRGWGVLGRARWRRFRDRRGVDVLLCHAPPRGVGDGDDPPHWGFESLHRIVDRLRPPLLLHGHIHPYGAATPDRLLGDTVVRNVVGHHVFEIGPGVVYTEGRAA